MLRLKTLEFVKVANYIWECRLYPYTIIRIEKYNNWYELYLMNSRNTKKIEIGAETYFETFILAKRACRNYFIELFKELIEVKK